MKNSVFISIFTIASLCAAQFETNQCGPTAGNQKCRQNKCCSQYGWCGTSNAYCQASQGCQPGFGRCTGVLPSSKSSLLSAVPTPSASSASISRNGRCGSAFGGQACKGSIFGDCCSTYNWCGKTTAHCKASLGCQPGFGTCNGVQSSAISNTQSRSISSATSKESSATRSSSLIPSSSPSSSAIAASSTTLSALASVSSAGSSSDLSSQSSQGISSTPIVATSSASQSSSTSISIPLSSSSIDSSSSSIAAISSSISDLSSPSPAVSSFSSSLMLSSSTPSASPSGSSSASLSESPSAALVSPINTPAASPSSSGSAAVITHVLRAARNPSIDRTAPGNLVPKNALSFFFAEDGTSYTKSIETNLDSGALGVLLENIASLSSVTCSGSSISLQFSDEASANTARNWPAGTVLFTLSDGCNTATERGVYRLRATVTTTTPPARLRARVTSVAQSVNAWSFTLEALLIQMVAVVADYEELKKLAAEEVAAAASSSMSIPSATVSSVAVSSSTGAQPSASATGLPACGGYAPGGRFDIGGTSYQISCTLAGTWRERWIDFTYLDSFAACLAHCNALPQCVVASWNVQQVSNGKFMCLRWPILPFKTDNAVDAPMAVKVI